MDRTGTPPKTDIHQIADWACPDKTDHHDVGNNPAEEVQMARRERRKFSDEYKADVVAWSSSTSAGPETRSAAGVTEEVGPGRRMARHSA